MNVVTCVCGGSFQAPDQLAGKFVNCPTCGRSLQVPAGSSGSTSPFGQPALTSPFQQASTTQPLIPLGLIAGVAFGLFVVMALVLGVLTAFRKSTETARTDPDAETRAKAVSSSTPAGNSTSIRIKPADLPKPDATASPTNPRPSSAATETPPVREPDPIDLLATIRTPSPNLIRGTWSTNNGVASSHLPDIASYQIVPGNLARQKKRA